jgi:drug/metabolite transporter (DMT)-like permease
MELKRSKNHLIVGAIILVFGVIVFVVFDLLALGIGLVFSGLVLFIAGLYRATKPETKIRLDERMRRIDEKAGYFAFWLTFSTIGILFWVSIYLPDRFRTTDILSLLMLIGIYAFLIIRFYYNRKGFK